MKTLGAVLSLLFGLSALYTMYRFDYINWTTPLVLGLSIVIGGFIGDIFENRWTEQTGNAVRKVRQ